MQKITKKIILLIIILVINFIGNSVSFATSSVNTRTRATASNNSTENEVTNTTNQVTSETIENRVTEENDIELAYPAIEKDDKKFGPLTMEQIIGGAAVLLCFVGIILAISLYSRSRIDEDDWDEDDYINEEPELERQEPKAMKELKDEAAAKEPKAIQEMEDEKKLEEIRKVKEAKKEETPNNKEEIKEKIEKKEDTASLNYRHQKALDDFYNYAEEIKQEKKTKRGKGKHSM